jgi:hypothetical protein
MGQGTEIGFGEDFVGLGLGGSSILGIVGLGVMRKKLRFG